MFQPTVQPYMQHSVYWFARTLPPTKTIGTLSGKRGELSMAAAATSYTFTSTSSTTSSTSPRDHFQKLVARSAKCPYEFPVVDNRLVNLCTTPESQELAGYHAQTTRPLMNAKVASLCASFLEVKRASGSAVEASLYEDMSVVELMQRLLAKRPLVFYTGVDRYTLTSGASGADPEGFDLVGRDSERHSLRLADVMSYDEMNISALMAVSVPTYFINSGSRGNMGRKSQQESQYEKTGVYVAQVGARFERDERMEAKHMLVSAAQNTPANGYADTKFYPEA